MTKGRTLVLGLVVVVALTAALGATATPPGRHGPSAIRGFGRTLTHRPVRAPMDLRWRLVPAM
jgi:hypothetical protein